MLLMVWDTANSTSLTRHRGFRRPGRSPTLMAYGRVVSRELVAFSFRSLCSVYVMNICQLENRLAPAPVKIIFFH